MLLISKADFERYIGKWVRFRTPYGYHQGIVERVTEDSVVVVAPKQWIPVQLATEVQMSDLQKLDISTANLSGFGRPYGGYAGVPYAGMGPGYGFQGTSPRYGGFGPFGFARWSVAFLIIFALFGLWGFFW